MKVCSNCEIEKNLESFYPKVNQCKNCIKEKQKQYRESNKKAFLEKAYKYRINNKEKIADYKKKYRKSNFKKLTKKNKEYREANKEVLAEKYKKYRESNKEKLAEQKKIYYQENKEKIANYKKKYFKNNKEKINTYRLNYQQNRKKNDLLFRFKHNLTSLIRGSFKRCNHRKNSKTADILGCSLEDFKIYIQSKLKKGMTLENHGKWHLDHIIPVSLAKTEQDMIRLNHYTNFQPLWAKDNLKKSDKIIEQQLILL